MYDNVFSQMGSNLKTPQSTPHGLRRIRLYMQNNHSVEYSPLAALSALPKKEARKAYPSSASFWGDYTGANSMFFPETS